MCVAGERDMTGNITPLCWTEQIKVRERGQGVISGWTRGKGVRT